MRFLEESNSEAESQVVAVRERGGSGLPGFMDTEYHWEEDKVLKGLVAIFVYKELMSWNHTMPKTVITLRNMECGLFQVSVCKLACLAGSARK